MSRSTSVSMLSRRVYWIITEKTQPLSSKYSTMMHSPDQMQSNPFSLKSPRDRIKYNSTHFQHNDSATSVSHQIGENVPRKDKITFLVKTLMDLKDSKEVVYSTLDAWVAWERNFPIGALKNVLLILEKDQQWHRMIQVIKWMLSKGQGNTRGTYGQLIQALDMDDRAEEAYDIWKKKLAFDLHSVPWKLCKLMISIYYRNNRLEDLVKLFNGLEDFDRKPPEKSIVRKVADAYELLGKPEGKERILEKYKDLFTETTNGKAKKHGYSTSHKRKSGKQG
ncbi:pentatricopeptide repeat-containing protein chloroplastic [Dorcoceras hygrometricum]|uniref:Pentatricopeptide repeat-containing protein chloroplastic n=1 Tax=Dorcoceras hygrometricum TaxID=472368 RepID=A0A2Z7CRW0_9LAMI|nr:pentatricopeptide repeat-containing protein chloroplastic [Dorcoceras hygrometricum]